MLKKWWQQPAVRQAVIVFVLLRLFLSGWAMVAQLASPVPDEVDEVVRPYLNQPILNDGASVINLSSVNAYTGMANTAIYAASKAALSIISTAASTSTS